MGSELRLLVPELRLGSLVELGLGTVVELGSLVGMGLPVVGMGRRPPSHMDLERRLPTQPSGHIGLERHLPPQRALHRQRHLVDPRLALQQQRRPQLGSHF